MHLSTRQHEELLEVPHDRAGLAPVIGRLDELLVERVPLRAVDAGTYEASDQLATGLWRVQVGATIDGSSYRKDYRLFVNDQGVGRLQ